MHNDLDDAPGTASSLWPMSAPYNRWFVKGNWQPEKHESAEVCRQKAVNLMILALSWLHMKSPCVCPRGLSRHHQLSRKQWGVVKRLETMFSSLEAVGDIGPSQMGRAAAKNEGLDSLLHDLHERAAFLANVGYATCSSKVTGDTACPVKPGHQSGDAGVVVGRISRGTPILAKDIEPDRLSFPRSLPEFDPTELLHGAHREVYLDPIALANSPDAEGEKTSESTGPSFTV